MVPLKPISFYVATPEKPTSKPRLAQEGRQYKKDSNCPDDKWDGYIYENYEILVYLFSYTGKPILKISHGAVREHQTRHDQKRSERPNSRIWVIIIHFRLPRRDVP